LCFGHANPHKKPHQQKKTGYHSAEGLKALLRKS
jgi:hypothetical protein